jgi:hypothetical protein
MFEPTRHLDTVSFAACPRRFFSSLSGITTIVASAAGRRGENLSLMFKRFPLPNQRRYLLASSSFVLCTPNLTSHSLLNLP